MYLDLHSLSKRGGQNLQRRRQAREVESRLLSSRPDCQRTSRRQMRKHFEHVKLCEQT